MSDKIYEKFDDNFKKLSTDIKYIELKTQDVQDRITEIDIQLDHIKNTIPTLSGSDKAKMYGIYNELLKLLSQFYSNLAVFVDLRQKYRSQEGDLKYKSVRLIELEMKKLDENTDEHEKLMRKLSNSFEEADTELNDDKYKI